MIELKDLPGINALLNLVCTSFLVAGYVNIKRGRRDMHMRFMLLALGTSILFLGSYVIYHVNVGSVPYPYHDWTRTLYFSILVPHILLAAIMLPLIAMLLWYAIGGNFSSHKRLARWVWPIWMFVSISGVLIYLLLYR